MTRPAKFVALAMDRARAHFTAVMLAIAVGLATSAAGCGPSVPGRFVLERDVGSLRYRRYQRVLDVEFAIEGNAAEGHTATYVGRSGREVSFVTVFVTVYTRPEGLAAQIRRQVRALGSYEVQVRDIGGYAWFLDGGPGDQWFLWVSAGRVVKVGGSADEAAQRAILGEYMAVYPSDLDEHGRARAGTASAGHDSEAESTEGDELPISLDEEPEGS